MSTPARLLDQYGQPLAVSNKQRLTSRASGVPQAGVDENNTARIKLVESKFRATVRMGVGGYVGRFSPWNVGSSSPTIAIPRTRYSMTMPANNALTTTNGFIQDSALNITTFSSMPIIYGADDSPTGIGAQEMCMVWWGTDGNRYVTTFATGSTPLSFTPPVFLIERLFATKVGSLGCVGDIVIPDTDSIGTLFEIQNPDTSLVEVYIATNKPSFIPAAWISPKNAVASAKLDLAVSLFDFTALDFRSFLDDIFSVGAMTGSFSSTPLVFNPAIYVDAPPSDCISLIYDQGAGASLCVVEAAA